MVYNGTMFLGKIKKNWEKLFVWALFVAFIIIPFFWYPRGAMDLGGDGSRLYFYDPFNFLKSTTFFGVVPIGKGDVDATKHAYLLYVLCIALLKSIFHSSNNVINLWNGMKLSVGFLSIYLIVKEMILYKGKGKISLTKELAAILSGIFYIFSTGSLSLVYFWIKALHSHDQVFLNPLIFWLLLKYFLSGQKKYLLIFLILSFVFSLDFSIISAPPFFAFYPLAMLFLFLYVRYIRKVSIRRKELLLGICAFFGLQAFHLIPSLIEVLQPRSITNIVVFDKASNLAFFDALRGYGLVSTNIILSGHTFPFAWVPVIIPLVIIGAFLIAKNRNATIFLLSIFFFVTLYLVSANITNTGFVLYRVFFYFPGFSIFRHFFIQWAYVFIFFYALLFGQSLFILFKNMKSKYIIVFSLSIGALFVISFWPFLNGSLVDAVQWGSRGVKTAMIMDPRYEATLQFIRNLPTDGKMLLLPITDNFNQVVFGINNAAYVGPSSISYLAERKSFEGYQTFDDAPLYSISNAILEFGKAKNYRALTQIFSLLSIKYIYYDSDPNIFEKKFPNFPNSYMMAYLPKTQSEYSAFLQNFSAYQIYKTGPYQIYQFTDDVYRPEIYTPDSIIFGDMVQQSSNSAVSFHSAFIDKNTCQQNDLIKSFCANEDISQDIHVTTKKINPILYSIDITQSESNKPLLLVFQNTFNTGWKVSFGSKTMSENQHIVVNRYANGWIIFPKDRNNKTHYQVTLVIETQKYFWYGLVVSGCTLVLVIACFLFAYVKKN